MIDALDLRITLQRDVIEAKLLALDGEGWLQRAQRLHRGFRPKMLIPIENDDVVIVANRNDRTRETTFRPGRSCALLAFDRVAVHVGAGIAMQGGYQVGGNSLRHKIVRQREV